MKQLFLFNLQLSKLRILGTVELIDDKEHFDLWKSVYYCQPWLSGHSVKVSKFKKQIFLFSFEPKNPFLEARAAIKNNFIGVFGSNENKKICFRNWLTFPLSM